MKKYISPIILLCVAAAISLYSVFSSHYAKDVHIDRKELMILAILDFVIFCVIAFVLFMRKRGKTAPKNRLLSSIITLFMVIQFPPVMFYVSQNLVDNFESFNHDFLNRNLLLFFLVFFALIFFLGNIRLSAIVLSVVTVVLSLTIYYVYLFRGSAFMLLEFGAFRTAADVADGYDFVVYHQDGHPDMFHYS